MPSMVEQVFCVETYLETKYFYTVQAIYRWKFNFDSYPNRSKIFKLV